jgi:hypothetical protein
MDINGRMVEMYPKSGWPHDLFKGKAAASSKDINDKSASSLPGVAGGWFVSNSTSSVEAVQRLRDYLRSDSEAANTFVIASLLAFVGVILLFIACVVLRPLHTLFVVTTAGGLWLGIFAMSSHVMDKEL